MKVHSVSDVFTPSSPARVNFVERNSINKRIVRALRSKGKQIVIYGHSGSGKTTLLENKLYQVYDKHIKTSCMKGMTFESVLLDAFDQLSAFYIDEEVKTEKKSLDSTVKLNFEISEILSYLRKRWRWEFWCHLTHGRLRWRGRRRRRARGSPDLK